MKKISKKLFKCGCHQLHLPVGPKVENVRLNSIHLDHTIHRFSYSALAKLRQNFTCILRRPIRKILIGGNAFPHMHFSSRAIAVNNKRSKHHRWTLSGSFIRMQKFPSLGSYTFNKNSPVHSSFLEEKIEDYFLKKRDAFSQGRQEGRGTGVIITSRLV